MAVNLGASYHGIAAVEELGDVSSKVLLQDKRTAWMQVDIVERAVLEVKDEVVQDDKLATILDFLLN